MKKAVGNVNIQSPKQFFQEVKQYMKMKSTKQIRWNQLKNYNYNSQQNTLQRLSGYITSKIKVDKNTPDKQCANNLMIFFEKEKFNCQRQRFKIDNEGINYIPKFNKIQDPRSLLKEIQNTPEGILVDDQLLKFTVIGIKDFIRDLVNSRLIIPVKSKNIQKSKIKQDNYQGYILFPFPAELKQNFRTLFKTSYESLKNQINQKDKQRQKKMQRIYGTRTSIFRKQFQNICSSNAMKGQNKNGLRENQQSFQSRFNGWDQINKKSIPNFQVLAQQWFKNRK